MYRLRVKTKGGEQLPLTDRVNGDSSLGDLQKAVHDITSIAPERQKILTGFPPKPIQGSHAITLSEVGIRNGDVLIVEDVEPSTNTIVAEPVSLPKMIEVPSHDTSRVTNDVPKEIQEPLIASQNGILLKKVVPSDNSCLFASVYYLINGGCEIDLKAVQEMRKIVASAVKNRPDLYHEAILEKSNEDYCKWIVKETSWGGAIELSVLSQYYEMEIVALDAKTGVLNRFGEDKKYSHRMIVMYDGIHYDPLYVETPTGGIITVFQSSDESILNQAKEIGLEAKRSGQFTDTNVFSLECKQCGEIIRGDQQALAHAKKTGHSKFEEVRRN